MALFKQEIVRLSNKMHNSTQKSDEKELLEGEKKFLKSVQESMNSMNKIITNTREQLEANLASTQTIFNENVKSINPKSQIYLQGLSKTIELMKENVYNKLQFFDTSLKDLDEKVGETQKSFHEHTITINEVFQF